MTCITNLYLMITRLQNLGHRDAKCYKSHCKRSGFSARANQWFILLTVDPTTATMLHRQMARYKSSTISKQNNLSFRDATIYLQGTWWNRQGSWPCGWFKTLGILPPHIQKIIKPTNLLWRHDEICCLPFIPTLVPWYSEDGCVIATPWDSSRVFKALWK